MPMLTSAMFAVSPSVRSTLAPTAEAPNAIEPARFTPAIVRLVHALAA